jgi:hypothetical protein
MTASTPLPDIVIGGAPRSGTTFLCELLAKHPQIHVAQPFIPEPKICMVEPADGGRWSDRGRIGLQRRLVHRCEGR